MANSYNRGGQPGVDGKTVLNGSGAPISGLGNDGDFYINTANYDFYGPKTAGAWGSPVNLVGPAGADGTDGTDGTDGLGVPAGGTTGQLLAKLSDNDNDTAWVDAPVATGPANTLALFDAAGELTGLGAYVYNPSNFNGMQWAVGVVPVTSTDYRTLHSIYADFNPVVVDSRANWRHFQIESAVGTDNLGNKLGDNVDGSISGLGVTVRSNNGSSVGRMQGIDAYVEIGHNNPTPVAVTSNNISVYSGTVYVRENATANGASFLNLNFNCGETNAKFNNNVSGININGNITEIDGNGFSAAQTSVNIGAAGYVDGYKLAITVDEIIGGGANVFSDFSNYGIIDQGYFGSTIQPNIDECDGFFGLNVNPTVTLCNYAYGVNSDVSNITVYAGVVAQLVKQDITYTGDLAGQDYNQVTIEYTSGATAGSEVVSVSGFDITVQIESGVSTAQQVVDALDAAGITVGQFINYTITGTASNPQVTSAAQNLAGGVNPGFKRAGYFKGDVQIDGSLSFTGGLSIGALTSFGPYTIVSGSGTPTSTHTLITNPTLGDNLTVTLADYLGVNTAMLLQVGANSNISTGFLGMTALGLPAVVGIGAGSTIDRVGGAVFAINLDGASGAGSNIDIVSLCRSLALPNGITTVGRLYGYEFDLPFGDPGTDTWGLFIKAGTKNYLEGALVIGAEDPTNADVGFEIGNGKAMLWGYVDNAGEAAITAVNGMVVYNTDLNKFRGYENGAWANLI